VGRGGGRRQGALERVDSGHRALAPALPQDAVLGAERAGGVAIAGPWPGRGRCVVLADGGATGLPGFDPATRAGIIRRHHGVAQDGTAGGW